MKRSTVFLLVATVLISIALLGQIGPLRPQLQDVSAVSLILGLVFGMIGCGAAAKERRR